MSSVWLGFPFWNLPRFSFSSSSARRAATIAALAAGSAAALAVAFSSDSPEQNSGSRIPFASLSLDDSISSDSAAEVKNGTGFPTVVDGGRRLLGVGMRRSNVLGLKSIDVYSFGVYADESDIKKVAKENGSISTSDTLENDIKMTIRLQIVYSRLSIKSVRNAFGKSVGNRLQKFNDGSDTNDLLQRFVSMFRDEQKLPKGSVIELSREEGFVLQTKIDGKEVGRIQSKLLCKSILDLYLGDDPFDKRAKDEIQLNLTNKTN
ncbi:hypothetical protein LUZ60_005253 [Juncus effusus]|nr:hypothetical protein LUZ60_005253 [Juncus effusus]